MENETEPGDVLDPSSPCLARELARMNLTLNYYTEWYWKTNLHNLFHFLSLRGDHHAQYEIRAYADVMLDMVSRWVPMATEAFREHRLEGASFSKTALSVIRRMIRGEAVTLETSGLSKREWADVTAALSNTDSKNLY